MFADLAQPPDFPLALNRGRLRLPCYYRQDFNRPNGSTSLTSDVSRGPQETMELLRLARGGDRLAEDALFQRLAPPLERWAHGRLPGWARSMVSTTDLVQEALASTYRALQQKDDTEEFAVHAYLRTALKSRLVDELRKVQRRPALQEMKKSVGDDSASPLQEAIGTEALERYEAALASLDPTSREAVIARLELGLPFAELAPMIGKTSADAARMTVSRAMVKLAEAMSDE